MRTPNIGTVLYLEVAASIRQAILSGERPPGSALPPEQRLAAAHGCGRDTVRDALDVLRSEGLVTTTRGKPTRVTPLPEHQPARLESGATVIGRMATRPESDHSGWPTYVPLLVVTGTNVQQQVYRTDRTALVVP
ncbi:GntR family transcriptional regulator [Dactylosporangium siamense]|uniref:GntR family transcriptional regulator n=1 Tax=Dactylosporangium siamense TaxID=685454 RepID=UPI003CD084F1